MNFITEVRAQENDYEAQPQAEEFSLASFMPLIIIFAIFYFLIIRPQNKKMKEHQKLVGSVKKGDEVITNSGIFGKITQINEKDNSVNLEISEDVEIKILKNYITDVVNKEKKNKKNK